MENRNEKLSEEQKKVVEKIEGKLLGCNWHVAIKYGFSTISHEKYEKGDMKDNEVSIMRCIHDQAYTKLLHRWMEAAKGTEDVKKREYNTFRRLM